MYSDAVCNYIYRFARKIKILDDLYQDEDAKKFLEEFEAKRKENKTLYSALEKMIREYVIKKGMINEVEAKQWDHLKDYRDYCAHPVVGAEFELISPKHEQVRAHLRNMFEAIFLKDAILNKTIFDEFLIHIKSFYDRNGVERFAEYVDARYVSRLDFKAKCHFVKCLWKYAFWLNEDECDKYRRIAYRALVIIIESDRRALLDYMEKEKSFINGHIRYEQFDISKDDKSLRFYDNCSTSVFYLLFKIPEVVKILSKDNIEELRGVAQKNVNIMLLGASLYETSERHIAEIKKELSGLNYCFKGNIFKMVADKAIEQYDYNYNDLAIFYFFNCQNSSLFKPDWDYINWTYNGIIRNVLPSFTLSQIECFVSQLTDFYTQANCFKKLAEQVKEVVIANGYDIDFCLYEIDLSEYWEGGQEPEEEAEIMVSEN